MISILRQRFFDKHYNKLLKKQAGRVKPRAVNTFSTVTLLVSGEYYRSGDLREAKKALKKQNITVHPYLVDTSSEGIDDEGVSVISKADCTWYGLPSQELLINWLTQKTDLLIASNPADTPLLRYLTASSNSRLKASLEYDIPKDPMIDLYIDTTSPFELSLKEQCQLIYKTLSQIGLRPQSTKAI